MLIRKCNVCSSSVRVLFIKVLLIGYFLSAVMLHYMWQKKWDNSLDDEYTLFPLQNDYFMIKMNLSKYAVCKSKLTESLICNKVNEGRIYVSSTQDKVQWSNFASNNWGNTLSPYWQARGVAFLLGSSFQCDKWHTNTWMQFLPISRMPVFTNSCVKAYPELFDSMCYNSEPDCNMVYAHKCIGAWNHIRDEIQLDTRSAIEQWAKRNNRTIPYFNRTQMVMYDRCSNDTILDHPEHGPVAYTAFRYIPKTVKKLYQVYNNIRNNSLCKALRQAQRTYLKRLRPDITVISSSDDLWSDFTKLVYASYVLIMSAGSSFSLWSTLANAGHVWAPLYGGMTPNLGNNYHWINTPILYPSIGKNLNFTSVEHIIDRNKVIDWLMNN